MWKKMLWRAVTAKQLSVACSGWFSAFVYQTTCACSRFYSWLACICGNLRTYVPYRSGDFIWLIYQLGSIIHQCHPPSSLCVTSGHNTGVSPFLTDAELCSHSHKPHIFLHVLQVPQAMFLPPHSVDTVNSVCTGVITGESLITGHQLPAN